MASMSPTGSELDITVFSSYFCLTFQRMLAIPEQSSSVLTERHPEQLQKLEGIARPARLHADRDVHALGELQLLDVDLGEHDLLRDPHVVVPRLVEGPGREPPEVADARDHDRD